MIRALLSLSLLAAAPAAAQNLAIVNGRVIVGDGSPAQSGSTVLIRGGRIVAVGPGVVVPRGYEIVNANGRNVTPGIVAGFSRLGLAEVDLGASGSNDTSASGSAFNAAIDVAPAVNPKNTTVAVSRADGVTRAIVAPEAGRSIFAGQGAIIDTGADFRPTRTPKTVEP